MTTRRRVTTQRRKLIWARQPAIDISIAAAGGTTNVDLLANFELAYGAQLIGCTVMRIRGVISGNPVTASVAPVIAGVMVTNGNSVPISTIPGPITAPHADWMMYQPMYPNQGSGTTGLGLPAGFLWEFDVKSMRKLEELNQSLIMSLQAHPGSVGIGMGLTVSTLIALP